MSSRRCPNCGQAETIIEDVTNGYKVCSQCGAIIQDSILINEINFTEMSNGNSSRNGQFVAAAHQKSGANNSFANLQEGNARIQAICDQLPRLENQPDVCQLAERIFKLALREHFTRGRTIEIVAAAAVYVAIRNKKTTGYLLVDVADHIDCGVFELAATALRLSTCVGHLMPVVDPTLFIDRFTDELKFGHHAAEIKETAIQIIRRLDRDWIQTGRKPAGICGAAIMIAARIQGIELTKDTILKCARVCNATINKRLKEIARTELANSSIAELKENQEIFKAESSELPPSMQVKKELDEIALSLQPQSQEVTQSLADDFSDDELKDVDGLILNDEEMEKRSALFYTMYKSKLDQPPKEPKPKKHHKKQTPLPPRNTDAVDEGLISIATEIGGDDDELGDDDNNGFDDF